MKKLTLDEIKKLQREFDLSHGAGGKSFFVPISSENIDFLEHMAVCLVGEVGEFCNILKKIVRGDLTVSDARPDMAEELADVFIYLIKISNQFDINLEAEFLSKLDKNKTRFEEIK